jgi:hypothetical protein
MSYFNYTPDLRKFLKHDFQNIERLNFSCSQMQQDMFVLSILDGKQNGTYVEIGAHHPIGVNNTFVLETVFGWQGLSFELDIGMVAAFNMQRKNTCIAGDATQHNYVEIFQRYGIGPDIDYLSVDIEPPNLTFQSLRQVLEAGLKPTVITFEHEAMNGSLGQQVRETSRKYLKQQGYVLAVKDVSNLGVGIHDRGVPYPVEDWWVLLERIDQKIFDKLRADTVDFIESRNTVYNF